jgi:hypothetical protein
VRVILQQGELDKFSQIGIHEGRDIPEIDDMSQRVDKSKTSLADSLRKVA